MGVALCGEDEMGLSLRRQEAMSLVGAGRQALLGWEKISRSTLWFAVSFETWHRIIHGKDSSCRKVNVEKTSE